jgi:hypothetical protein
MKAKQSESEVAVAQAQLWANEAETKFLDIVLAREAGDSIKPRVEPKAEPWASRHQSGEPTKWAIDLKVARLIPNSVAHFMGLTQFTMTHPGFRLRLHPGLYAVARFAGYQKT